MPPESSSIMYFSASRPNNFTASLGSTDTSVLARLVTLLPALVLAAGTLAKAPTGGLLPLVGTNALAPEVASRKSAVALLIWRVIVGYYAVITRSGCSNDMHGDAESELRLRVLKESHARTAMLCAHMTHPPRACSTVHSTTCTGTGRSAQKPYS